MSDVERFRDFTVLVQSGSGCLFQPYSEEYTYVLTAKHNLDDVTTFNITRQILDENDTVQIETLTVIGAPFFHPDEEIDAAIIKVEKVECLPPLLRINDSCINPTDYYLCGHPQSRRGNDSYRKNKLTTHTKKHRGYIEGEVNRPVTHDEVVGQSGGGILKYINNFHFIAGIQKKMSAQDNDELLGRVDFMPLSFFDEIVGYFPDELAKIYPAYISSFLELIGETYQLEDLAINKKDLIKSELHGVAINLCEEFSPDKIINLYKNAFLIKNESTDSIYNSKLWVGFLELLILSQIQSERDLVFNDITEINKKNRLFFGTVEKKWAEVIKPLFLSDLSDVEKGGNIFVVTSNDDMPTKTEYAPKVIANIAQVSKRQMTISSPDISPYEDIKVKHIYKLQEAIIDNDVAFLDADVLNISDIIKNETQDIV
ncbi:ABC-three component system protein [Photobacterium leiognathi]|uniref:ABC-three component system protein n=1 Tax=Photobacterium leiognathi TaxID=553611 RepID=UPI0029817A8C|nr:ABC-three component system protein [Photobacterium leiognathi]